MRLRLLGVAVLAAAALLVPASPASADTVESIATRCAGAPGAEWRLLYQGPSSGYARLYVYINIVPGGNSMYCGIVDVRDAYEGTNFYTSAGICSYEFTDTLPHACREYDDDAGDFSQYAGPVKAHAYLASTQVSYCVHVWGGRSNTSHVGLFGQYDLVDWNNC